MMIRNDIPIPSSYRKYPFALMCVGDSFEAGRDELSRKRVSAAAHYYGRHHGKTFTVRKADDGSYRCWRTE